MLPVGTVKIEKTKQLPTVRASRDLSKTTPLRFCMSCPDIVPDSRTRRCTPLRHLSPPRTRPIRHNIFPRNALLLATHHTGSSPCMMLTNQMHTSPFFGYAKGGPCSCGCPCPFPCGPCGCPNGCNCLPPPCNQPPKCIQYMTGYYYYPYGFWFCGPYHVTGTCTPVGPCGPCPSNCPPCPCAKCCACLSPVAAAVVGGPQPQQCTQRTPASKPLMPSPINDIKYPLPHQDPMCSSASRSNISKFFPFNAVPSVDSIKRMPHTSVHTCPYSTQPINTYPEQKPVYCTPCVKQSKSNFSTRPRQPFTFNNQKPKKALPNSLSKSYSDYYEKRSESRSPIHHKRSKKFICEVCPLLENPRPLMTQEQRDRPHVNPGAFNYSDVPNYRSPYPQSYNNANFRAYDA